MGLTDNVISQQKAAMDKVRWESEKQCPQQTLHYPQLLSQHTIFKNPQTLLAHSWGNKLETNKSKWALSISTPRSPEHVPKRKLISFPALAGWGALLLARPTPVGPNGREGLIGTSGLGAALWALQAPLTFQKGISRSREGELRLINKEFFSLIKLLSKVVELFLRRNLGFLHQIYLLAFL